MHEGFAPRRASWNLIAMAVVSTVVCVTVACLFAGVRASAGGNGDACSAFRRKRDLRAMSSARSGALANVATPPRDGPCDGQDRARRFFGRHVRLFRRALAFLSRERKIPGRDRRTRRKARRLRDQIHVRPRSASARKAGDWTIDPAKGDAVRAIPPATLRNEVETCGLRHARRGQSFENWTPGQWLSDTHVVAPLSRGLYRADGQMEDEVYNYGSFKQSRMFAAGVACSDCHDPHSGKLRAGGDTVCLQCHAGDKYAAVAHRRRGIRDRPAVERGPAGGALRAGALPGAARSECRRRGGIQGGVAARPALRAGERV